MLFSLYGANASLNQLLLLQFFYCCYAEYLLELDDKDFSSIFVTLLWLYLHCFAGMHCSECGYNCHEKCMAHVPKNCTKINPVSDVSSSNTNISVGSVNTATLTGCLTHLLVPFSLKCWIRSDDLNSFFPHSDHLKIKQVELGLVFIIPHSLLFVPIRMLPSSQGNRRIWTSLFAINDSYDYK